MFGRCHLKGSPELRTLFCFSFVKVTVIPVRVSTYMNNTEKINLRTERELYLIRIKNY